MDGIKLTAYNIHDIGEYLSNKLIEYKATSGNKLVINVSGSDFSLIDEDLYYRMNKEAQRENFVPSEGVIEIKFDNLTIEIRKEQPNE